jgi:DNA-binding Xre family transcriptional regulator
MLPGADLLTWRERRGLGRGAVSGQVGISRSAISRLEVTGRVKTLRNSDEASEFRYVQFG